ncbi:MAG: hypothetical protein M0Q92_05880 [Methanoregula sp.]|jgi:hypothetical protein|nr:hypothetical protein [Methanoregula sp.]
MEHDKIIEAIRSVLSGFLIAILTLSFLMFMFVFIINWEDWFFGTRLAGPLAGAFLFARAAAALILIFLLVQYPKHRTAWTLASIAYFGFLFLNSSVTIRQNTAGQQLFSVHYAVCLAIPVILLIILLAGKQESEPAPEQQENDDTLVAIAKESVTTPKVQPLILLLIAMVGLMIVYILVIPFATAFIVTHLPSDTVHYATPSHDTLISKISPDGRTEYQFVMTPCNIIPLGTADGSVKGYLIFGASKTADGQKAVPYLVMLDQNGARMWNWSQDPVAGEGTPPVVIHMAYIEDDHYGVILSNKKEIVLDKSGSIISETVSSEDVDAQASFQLLSERFSSNSLPAESVSIRVLADDGERGELIHFKDTLQGREIMGINAIRTTADGGHLISASVKP